MNGRSFVLSKAFFILSMSFPSLIARPSIIVMPISSALAIRWDLFLFIFARVTNMHFEYSPPK